MIKKNVPLWVYIFIVALFLIVMALSACSSPAKLARKEAKKNEQAYQRVITDSSMFRSIGLKFARLQPPCANDTIVGETQVLILSDTTVLPGATDTIVRPDTIRITQYRTNTITQYVVDNRAIQELQDSLHDGRLREAQLFGKFEQLTADREKEKQSKELAQKRQRQLGWGLWGMLAVLVVSHGIRSIPSIRKAIGI